MKKFSTLVFQLYCPALFKAYHIVHCICLVIIVYLQGQCARILCPVRALLLASKHVYPFTNSIMCPCVLFFRAHTCTFEHVRVSVCLYVRTGIDVCVCVHTSRASAFICIHTIKSVDTPAWINSDASEDAALNTQN